MLTENPFTESSSALPILQCFHIAGFICGVGAIALVNFRLLGAALNRKSAAQLWRDTMPWTLAGLSVAIFSGLLLFSINPDVYYLNHVFVLKMFLLVLSIISYYTIIYQAAVSDSRRGWSRVAACLSLGLWALVLLGGIFIGSIGSALNNRI